MLQTSVPQQFNRSCITYSIAGKVFILGEYAVLAGIPALVGTLGPRFQVSAQIRTASFEDQEMKIHPASPLGRLQKWAIQLGAPELSLRLEDPYRGEGGFGASTAQFALGYMAYAQLCEGPWRAGNLTTHWTQVLHLYRELMADQPIRPSGADLVAQWLGGVVAFHPTEGHCNDLWPVMNWSSLLVFSAAAQAGRKTATHEHLASLAKSGFPGSKPDLISALKSKVYDGMNAIQDRNLIRLGFVLNQYAEILHSFGLEAEAAFEDRKILQNMPSVLGVKGTGALQSDGILVLMSPEAPRSDVLEVLEKAKARGLRLVSEGLTCEMGIRCLL